MRPLDPWRGGEWEALNAAGVTIPLIEDSGVFLDAVQTLIGRLEAGDTPDGLAACATIRALQDHIEAMYEALYGVAMALEEAQRGSGDARTNAGGDVVSAILEFLATIEHGERDPLFLQIARANRDEIVRAIGRWNAAQE